MLLPFFREGILEAGIDEAGRGCYAGPVFAAAVILPAGFCHPMLNDSKKLNETQRDHLKPIIEAEALAWAVGQADETEIDQVNILRATYRAMHRAIMALSVKPQYLLVDGNRFAPFPGISHSCMVKGDGTYASIAAASILAKTARDAYMRRLHEEFPQYGWNENKGYGTEKHRRAIAEFGLCRYHRKSFDILGE